MFAYIVANCLNTRGTSKRILRNQSVIEFRCEVNLQIEVLLASHCSSKDILIDNFIILSKSRNRHGSMVSAFEHVCQPTSGWVNPHGAPRYVIAHCCAIVTLGYPPDASGTDGERQGPEKFDYWSILESRRDLNFRRSRSNSFHETLDLPRFVRVFSLLHLHSD